jgi:hypothetical protein
MAEKRWLDMYGRNWYGPFPFKLEAVTQVAKEARGREKKLSGVYQILYMRQPVYIGISGASVFGRLRNHVQGSGNRMAGKRADAEFYEFVYWLCDEKSARGIESHVILTDKPGFNEKIERLNYMASIYVH